MSKPELGLPLLFGGLCLLVTATMAAEERFGFGQEATDEQIAGWDTDIRFDGQGLPEGSGTVKQGQTIFENQCLLCHGERGVGDPMEALQGGAGSLDTDEPLKTLGSYWPYAPVIMDYVHRAMPQTEPRSLSADELYAVTAYLLHINDLLPEDAELDADRLREIKMPNRDGFVPDPRPDVHNTPCMRDCKSDE